MQVSDLSCASQVDGESQEQTRQGVKPVVQEVEDSMKRGWAEIKDAVKSVTDSSGKSLGVRSGTPGPMDACTADCICSDLPNVL